MLKGHVQIDLHNHKTGLKDRIEKDNLVTNAAKVIASGLFGRNYLVSTITPLYTKFYGGIMLFDGALTENVNNMMFPTDVNLIGFAGRSTNTNDYDCGSINGIETGPIENGYKYVWDFSTSQANGIISSLSLTNELIVGYNGNNYTYNPYSRWLSDIKASENNNNKTPFKYENNVYYFYTLSNDSKLSIFEKRIPTVSYNIFDNPAHVGTEDLIDEVILESTAKPDNTYFMNDYAGDICDIRITEVSTGSYTASIDKVKLSDMSYSKGRNLTIYPTNVRTGTTGAISHSSRNRKACINNGKVYTISYNTYTIPGGELTEQKYMCSITPMVDDGTDITLDTANKLLFEIPVSNITKTGLTCTITPFGQDSCLVSLQDDDSSVDNRRRYGVVHSDGTFRLLVGRYLGNASTYDMVDAPSYLSNNSLIALAERDENRASSFVANYLGTICNLEDSIEKTSSTSMKVKYSLTIV